MLLILLFFLCESTVKSQNTTPLVTSTYQTTTTTEAAEEKPPSVQLVAKPDYPVVAGQRVDLYCSASTMPDNVTWSLQRLENQTWKEVNQEKELTLVKPEQSGLYRCHVRKQSLSESFSQNHTVFIISMPATVGENLGIAAFAISLLALMINFAIIFWLGWQRLCDTLTTSSIAAKGFPGPEKSSKGSLPMTDSERDVYMNYTSTNQAYTDLDPTNMTGDNVYSSLS